MMNIFPIPQALSLQAGSCPAGTAAINKTDTKLGKEEYRIEITEQAIVVTASCPEGFFRADATLRQIRAENPERIPCLQLHDYPDYPVRAVHIDNCPRIPRMEYFKKQIDLYAFMKINMMQIQVDPVFVDNPSFPDMRVRDEHLTVQELHEIINYAAERYITVFPTLQTFGHLEEWLSREPYAQMAECPDGYEMFGKHQLPGTLNPLDERSQQFVRRRVDDAMALCPHTAFMNIGGDETMELGMGKSREACEKKGKTRVFLDFLKQTLAYLEEHQITPLFWADMILEGNQDVLDDIPSNAIALAWGYERMQIPEKDCQRLQKSGVRYWVCPGTQIWASQIGMSYKCMQNIARCTVQGKRYGASGVFCTDWSDQNLHHLSPAYFGIAYGAAMSWHTAEEDFHNIDEKGEINRPVPEPDAAQIVKISPTVESVFSFLNRFVYQDRHCRMAQLAYDAGQYDAITKHYGIWNATHVQALITIHSPGSAYTADYTEQEFRDTLRYLDMIQFRLEHEPEMHCEDADIILAEYLDSISFLCYACRTGLYRLGVYDGKSRDQYAADMWTERNDFLRNHERVWLMRNRAMGESARPDRFLRQFDPKITNQQTES